MAESVTFTNKSDEVFQDGDLIVRPGESFSTKKDGRISQMREQYAWQFEEGEEDAPAEEEVQAEAADKEVRELRTCGHVELDDKGNQAEKVGNE